ncbi:hypothetical protein H4582DRAFT_1928213 [Lactarius indigo]|nr:hypothetical protein H4582DRAFT_1928213 [Lactarius indigo]
MCLRSRVSRTTMKMSHSLRPQATRFRNCSSTVRMHIAITQPFGSGRHKTVTATSQKSSNKKHTSTILVAGTPQSRARQAAAAAAAKKNSHLGAIPRKKLSHRQVAQTRDQLDTEFRDLRAKASTVIVIILTPRPDLLCIWRRVLICASLRLHPSDHGAAGEPAAA